MRERREGKRDSQGRLLGRCPWCGGRIVVRPEGTIVKHEVEP
jgi:DNA-directed RNA polymerase subunit RPC12/RpoP